MNEKETRKPHFYIGFIFISLYFLYPLIINVIQQKEISISDVFLLPHLILLIIFSDIRLVKIYRR